MSDPTDRAPVQTPAHDEEIDLAAARDRARAEDTIAAAQTGEQSKSAWTDPPAVSDLGPIRRGDSSTRLAAWTPEMDQVREIREMPPENFPSARRPAMATGRSQVPRQLVSQRREQCPHCQGSGFMPGINDYLRESVTLIGDKGDEVVRSFYVALFRAAPDTAALFPGDPTQGDLGSDHKGARQRDKLLRAVVALADLYDPDDPDKMARLDTALKSFGRSHAAFVRSDGTIRGATWEEYAAVKDALFQTLVRAAESAWKAEYTEAWSQAYDYAAAVMIAEQHRSGFTSPRFPRA